VKKPSGFKELLPEFVPSHPHIQELLNEIKLSGHIVLIDFGRRNGGVIAVHARNGRRGPDDICNKLHEYAAEIRALFALEELQLHVDARSAVSDFIIKSCKE
jgi:hypothetical protein